MKRLLTGKTLAIGAATVLSITLARAADDLPKAETILDKYIEATGGKAAYQKHHSEVEKSTMEMAAMGIKASVTAYRVEPNKSLAETDLGGIGKMRDGSDGTVYWQSSSMMGPHVKEGAEKTQAMIMARFNLELNWREVFKDAKTTGTDTVDGKECYKVELTPAEGPAITQCYDKESGLMVKQVMTTTGPMGEVTAESFASDYRKEDDVLVPHKMKTKVAGQEVTMTVDSVTFNSDIPADKFALPDEIKALVKK